MTPATLCVDHFANGGVMQTEVVADLLQRVGVIDMSFLNQLVACALGFGLHTLEDRF